MRKQKLWEHAFFEGFKKGIETKHNLNINKLNEVSDGEALDILFKFATCDEKIDLISARWLKKQLALILEEGVEK